MDCLVYGHIGWRQLSLIDDRKRAPHTSKQTTEDAQPETIGWVRGMSARTKPSVTQLIPNNPG